MSNSSSEDIHERLVKLEKRLRELLESANRDLQIAKRLQALVVRNRLPSIPGVELLARHFQGSDSTAETFDIIPTKDFREVFIVVHWSETFGMSSILLETLIHLQTKASIEAHPEIDLSILYSDIQAALNEHNQTAHFRLNLLRIDLHTLKFSMLSKGFYPWLSLNKNKWKLIDGSDLEDLSNDALDSKPTSEVIQKQGIIGPGTKLFFLSREWNYQAKTPSDYLAPLELDKINQEDSLLNILNTFMRLCEHKIQEEETAVDLTAIAIKIDSKKIHLA